VSIEMAELKARLLKLLEEDAEFRYAVAGLIGLGEILKRLDRHEEELVRIREEQKRVWEEIAKLWNEVARLREDLNRAIQVFEKRFETIDKRFEEVDRRFEIIVNRLDRHEEEIRRLREDMVKGFERHDMELAKLREDFNRAIQLFDKRFEEVDRRFDRVERRLSALGARWGVESEESFREGLRGVLEKELGFKVERWKVFDDKGMVFGYPSEVEVDVTIVNEKVILIEVSSHVRASDVYQFKRKAELYKEKTGREPDRLIIITPYADGKAFETAVKLGVEIYTKV